MNGQLIVFSYFCRK